MASDAPMSNSSQQPFAHPHPTSVLNNSQATSPPTKQSLKTWWKTFSKPPTRNQEHNGNSPFSWYPASAPFRSEQYFYTGSLIKNLHSNTHGIFRESFLDNEEYIRDGEDAPEEALPDLLTPSRVRPPPARFPKTPESLHGRRFSSYVPALATHTEHSLRQSRTVGRLPQIQPPFDEHLDVKLAASFRPLSSEENGSTRPQSMCKPHKPLSNMLRSWKPRVKENAKSKPTVPPPTGIFGVPLRQSITYANVAISLVDAEGRSYIYGYVPIVVAKCGVYLKEKATNVEGIFRLSGSEKRIKELRNIFDSPDRYGKGLDWAGYTVHDAANVLRRYLNQLPEPIVPLDLYERFREPLRGFTKQAVGDAEGPQLTENFDVPKAIVTYQKLITELPPLNRQLLLYILDLLAVFASKSDENRMTSANLSAIFQPGMLSHPIHDMEPEQYRLSQDVLIFLIVNQDHFLIGMRGTAADEQTVQEVQNGGTPPPGTPSTPGKTKNTVVRTASNASAGADSIRKFGGVRRNVSVSSRHSKQSNGAPSPASPAYGPALTPTASGGVHRSNTVPSKRSPGLPSNRLQRTSASPSPTASAFVSHQHMAPRGLSPAAPLSTSRSISPSSPGFPPTALGLSSIPASTHAASVASQERLLGDQNATPTRERNISNLFQRSPTSESDKKQPNKLRKKRIPSSSNPSAQSSTQSFHTEDQLSPALHPTHPISEVASHPLESIPSAPTFTETPASPPATETPQPEPSGHEFPIRPEELHQTSENTLKPASPPASLHSRSSFNDQSDLDHPEDLAAIAEQKEKRSRWRISRHNRDSSQAQGNALSPKKGMGSDVGAGASNSSIGSSSRPRKSFTADTMPANSDATLFGAQPQPSHDGAAGVDEKKGPLGWIKNKMREKREEKEAEKERTKSPPASTDRIASSFSSRGKSMDVKRQENPERPVDEPAVLAPPQPPQR